MAPEQLEGREVDARADIFAFGAVLYEMITGRKAFEGTSQAVVMSAILSSDPPAVGALQPLTPPALDQVIRSCLAKDRKDRWASAHDVLLQLEWIAGHLSSMTVPAGVAQNRRREVLAWTVAAMTGLALVALWAWTPQRPSPAVRPHVSPHCPLSVCPSKRTKPPASRPMAVGCCSSDTTPPERGCSTPLRSTWLARRSRWHTPTVPRCPSGHPTAGRSDSSGKAS